MVDITMPNGDVVGFPDEMPREQIREMILKKFPDAAATAGLQRVQVAPDDHGLARRQAMSPAEKAISPITEWPRHARELSTEATNAIGHGAGQIANAVTGNMPAPDPNAPPDIFGRERLWEGTKGVGNIAAGALGAVFAPVSAAYRSVIGQPIEDVTGIPREHTEFTAQLATPWIGFTRMPRAPGAPVNPNNYRPGSVGPGEVPTLGTGPSGADAAAAMQRLRELEREQGLNVTVDLPRALTTDSTGVERWGQGLSNTPVIGDPIAKAVHDTVPAQIRNARDALATQRGAATEANAAGRAADVLAERAAAETKAATEAAQRGDEAAAAAHQKAANDAYARIAAYEAESAGAVEARTGRVNPNDTGAQATEAFRAADEAAQANKNTLYKVAGEAEGTIKAEGVKGVRARADQALQDANRAIDPDLTPTANRMLKELDDFEKLEIPNTAARTPDTNEIVGISLQGAERVRQRLNSFSRNAKGSEDAAAARKIIDSFDDWQADAMQTSLLSGDPKALDKFLEARKANRDWRETFGYNEKKDVNNLAQKVLHQDVTPQEVASYLIGSGKIGKQGTTSRLYTMLMKATGNNEELAQSIRGAIWENLSSSKNAAADIREFVHKSGRDLAEKVFPEGSRELMLRHADILDAAKTARDRVGEVAKANAPKPTKVEKGPMQQLADRVIGGKMDKNEALWRTIEGYTKDGGDLKALAGLMREIPQSARDDIAGAVIRGLGDSARTGQFSLETFASDWGKITPQAKMILFGQEGSHVKALDDIALIAQRLKDVKGKYGNSSGTAQTTAMQKLMGLTTAAAGGTYVSPALTALGFAGAGVNYVVARVLASPAGASSLAKHAKALEQQAKTPTPMAQALVSRTERNLVNTIKTLGATRVPQSGPGLRALQGPVPAGAENEQR